MAVTIQQAANNALAAHLSTNLPDVRIEEHWPDPSNRLILPTITILHAGPRQDLAIDMRDLAYRVVGNTVNFKTQLSACHQPLQLDIWASDQVQRDNIIARLDFVLNMDTINGGYMHGLNLAPLDADNWSDTFFDFYFESPELDDTPFDAFVEEWRCRYRGHAWMMLAVDRTAPRQSIIDFQLKIREN